MKLEQGQIWKQGENYIRIVEWARLSIEYKVMKDPISKVGTMHKATKKEFCRLLKGAVLLKPEDLPSAEAPAEEEEEFSAELEKAISQSIAADLRCILDEANDGDSDLVLEAHARLKDVVSTTDLPLLLDALKSPDNNFWSRELIGELVAKTGGSDCLADLLEALAAGVAEGHDNDGLQSSLIMLAKGEPVECRRKLSEMLAGPNFKNQEAAEWLLTFIP
ncbi:hypothetical protein [Prosthecobacter fluviatilis]|uniref:Uncharacterized protein n=1 Tax=Prosthecobacter fluviatilis TaxID=445931 RepID=A0ABW0KLP3_9BACT